MNSAKSANSANASVLVAVLGALVPLWSGVAPAQDQATPAAAAAPANGTPSDDGALDAVEQALQAAITRVAPSIVTVETFGGTRRMLAAGGQALDGPGGQRPDRRRPGEQRPPGEPDEPQPDEQPPGAPKPAEPPKPEDKKPAEKKPEEKKLGPIVMPGFLQAQGATTGVVLHADGWILVSRFALNLNPTTILVTLADGRSFQARRAGEDTSRGLALLKIDATGLPVPEFVLPKDVRVGQWAFALGRTFGRERPSVHAGIVAAIGRLFGRALQIDANTSPANYGGPVIDLAGRVLGISVPLSPSGKDAGADLYDSGIGFAATVADIAPLLERMQAGEVLHRGYLGVTTKADHLGPGAVLENIAPNGVAAAAGLKKGDVVLAIDQVPVQHAFHLQMLIGAKMAGDPVHLKIRRGEEEIGITVFVAPLPEAERKAKPATEGEQPQFPWEKEK